MDGVNKERKSQNGCKKAVEVIKEGKMDGRRDRRKEE